MSKHRNADVNRLRAELVEAISAWGRSIANEHDDDEVRDERGDEMLEKIDTLCTALDEAVEQLVANRESTR